MRSAAVFSIVCVTVSPAAMADTTALSRNGAWLTLGSDNGAVKGCAVQTEVNGGKFALGGVTDRQGVLTLTLTKATWTIPELPVPLVFTFASGGVMRLSARGVNTTITADIPVAAVKVLIHRFTAESSVDLTFPEGREADWRLDLHGTTPATLAMAECIDAAQLVLPSPFRKPNPPAPPSPSTQITPDEGETSHPQSLAVDNITARSLESHVSSDVAKSGATDFAARPDGAPQAQVDTKGIAEPSSPAVAVSAQPTNGKTSMSSSFLVFLGLVATAATVWKVVSRRLATRKWLKTVQSIEDEIQHNARALNIKRRQTVQKDEYGTWVFDRWYEAKRYYCKTRIAPILVSAGY